MPTIAETAKSPSFRMDEFLNFLQSASNAAASNISGPVDILQLLLQKSGLPVSNAVGSSDWMKSRGLMRDVPQSAATLAGETLGMISPMMVTAKAPQIAAGMNQMAANAMAPRTMNPQAGMIKTWGGFENQNDYLAGQYKARLEDERMKDAWQRVMGGDVQAELKSRGITQAPPTLRDIEHSKLYGMFPGSIGPENARAMLERGMLNATKEEQRLLRKHLDANGRWFPRIEGE
jgi:hypothetical protein